MQKTKLKLLSVAQRTLRFMIDDKTPPKLAEIIRDTWPQLYLLKTAETNTSLPSETDDNNSSETTEP